MKGRKRYGYCSIMAELCRWAPLSWQKSSQGDFCHIRFAGMEDAEAFSLLFEAHFLKSGQTWTVYVPIVKGTSFK